jgi:hypothetical protein
MATLMIKDLALTEELDRKKMAAVRGGVAKQEDDNYTHKDQQTPGLTHDTGSMNGAWWIGSTGGKGVYGTTSKDDYPPSA